MCVLFPLAIVGVRGRIYQSSETMKKPKIPKAIKKLEKIKKFYDSQNGICPLCGLSLNVELMEYEEWAMSHLKKISPQRVRGRIDLNIDHIIPLAKGGADKNRNKQLVHTFCNSKKGDMLPEEYEQIKSKNLTLF